ncbi:MAG: hypothetical protein AAGB29_15045 [Planctomycetota bacterium]
MARRKTWLMLIAALAAIWGGLGVIAWLSSATAPTADRVVAYLDDHPLDAATDREAIIDGLASRVNRLDFDQRQDPALRERIESTFGAMTPAERNRYIDAVLPKGMEQLIAAINAMDREERQQLVDNALTEIRRARAEGPDPERAERMESEAFQRVVDEGMRNYLSSASAEAKLDLEPVVMEMQNMLRELR